MTQGPKHILNGWKEIAAYLGRDPRTVERWEKQRSLPVRRLPGTGRASVYALVPELEEWLAKSPSREPEDISGFPTQTPAPELTAGAASGGERDGSDAQQPGAVGARPQRRGRMVWAAATIVVLAVCCVAINAGWRRAHRAPGPDSVAVDPARMRMLVPSSAVLGVEELYLRGCYQEELRTPDSLHRALDAFSTAVEKDPRYAPAFSGLASTYILLREYSIMPDGEAYPRAKAAAQRAMTLDPSLPQAHAAAGFVDFFWDWNPLAAEQQFKVALQLNPGLALGHHWFGSVLTHEGRFREGRAELQVAQHLDPSSPAILSIRALALGLSGQPAQASAMLEDAIKSDSADQSRNPATMHTVLGLLSLMPPRNVQRFLSESARAAELRQDGDGVASMRLASAAYQAHGEQAMWRALLVNEQHLHAAEAPTYATARYEAELGTRERALSDLEALYKRHDPALIGIAVDPLFASLRAEPRYIQLRRAMGLPGVNEL